MLNIVNLFFKLCFLSLRLTSIAFAMAKRKTALTFPVPKYALLNG